jgi:hypothetical protein
MGRADISARKVDPVYPTHRCPLLWVIDSVQLRLPQSQCLFHSDAQGKLLVSLCWGTSWYQAFNPVAILLISFAFKIQEPNARLIAIVCVRPFTCDLWMRLTTRWFPSDVPSLPMVNSISRCLDSYARPQPSHSRLLDWSWFRFSSTDWKYVRYHRSGWADE